MIEIHMGVFPLVVLNKGKSYLTTKALEIGVGRGRILLSRIESSIYENLIFKYRISIEYLKFESSQSEYYCIFKTRFESYSNI